MSKLAGSGARPTAASTIIAAKNLCRRDKALPTSTPRLALVDRHVDEPVGLRACPIGGAEQAADFSALPVDQNRRGQPQRADRFDRFGARIRIEAQQSRLSFV